MPFTILLILLALLGLAGIFGVTYKIRGLKFALFTTGVALVVFSIAYVAIISAIVSAM